MSPTSIKKNKHIGPVDNRPHLSSSKGDELTKAMGSIHLKQKEEIVEKEASRRQMPYIDLRKALISYEALLLITEKRSKENKVVGFHYLGPEIRIGTTNPDNPDIQQLTSELTKEYKANVVVYLISENSLAIGLKKYNDIPRLIESQESGVEITAEAIKKQQKDISSLKEIGSKITKVPTTEVVTLIIGAALKSNASDIHIETEAEGVKIRLRVDGILHDIGQLPRESWGKIASRIKLVGGLKLNIFDKPQDGRFTIFLDDDKIEVRVSSVPTSYGESLVMRLLRFSLDSLAFDQLGITGHAAELLLHEIAKPNGMIITTGPTGSGKTTTLYAAITKLNKPGIKILTLEDPVEYKITGINQSQIDTKSDFTFAQGLKSIMRQDPDIIMVGEIRDLETAETSINAALTGHLVLTTLHTNSAAGAIPRFLAMGTKSFLLAPSINAIIGQRLVRRLCPDCKKEQNLKQEHFDFVTQHLEKLDNKYIPDSVQLGMPESIKIFIPTGCVKCNEIGYKGRIGIYEIMSMHKELEKMILSGSMSEYDIQDMAIKNGMITMVQDGLLKVLAGITSVEEILRQTK